MDVPATGFYLGTHKPQWLADARFAGVRLFVSRRTLQEYKRLPVATTRWALDSGGFTEVSKYGGWQLSASDYVAFVRRCRDEIGMLDWAAPQDWMCEPEVIAKTGLSVEEHQRLTVENFLELRALAPDLPIIPVLQGWEPADYERHIQMYAQAGIDLRHEPLVGVGSVCRRQGTAAATKILRLVALAGIPRVHMFGFKTLGLTGHGADLVWTSDSLAWSATATHNPPITGHDRPGPGRPRGHKTCANCADYALSWLHNLNRKIEASRCQQQLFS